MTLVARGRRQHGVAGGLEWDDTTCDIGELEHLRVSIAMRKDVRPAA